MPLLTDVPLLGFFGAGRWLNRSVTPTDQDRLVQQG